MRTIIVVLLCFMFFGCDHPAASQSAPYAKAGRSKEKYKQLTVTKLREYCRACHAIGPLRFIFSDDDQELWNDLFQRRSPNSGALWSEAIIEVLSWPSDAPPGPDEWIVYPVRDWMPKGIARYELADDRHRGKPVRELIIRTLRDGQ